MILLTILVFIIILGLLVFVHELGHFIMAKRAGMRVDEFGFGFPPRLFGIRRGETLYSINLIPLGGFVKILGEDGSQTVDPKSFSNKSFWRRFSVLIAGVTMNVILAWVLLSIGTTMGLPTLISENEQLPKSAKVSVTSVGIIEVASDTPAATIGLKIGDRIVKIAGEPIDSIEEAQLLTQSHAGQETAYEIRRGSEVFQKAITPRVNPPEGQGPLGIALGSIAYVAYPWYESIWRGLFTTVNLTWLTLSAFGDIITQAFRGENIGAVLSGPVGIAVLTRDVTRLGLIYLIQFTALLSVNLAILNAVPFPALDGGRVLFLIIEKIRRKKLPIKAEQLANAIGFMLLITLMIFVTVKDFGRFEIIDKVKNLF
ncbi:MAG: RIP metalloprotease RseP [Candidatus Doudnabacteria bacterium RIFCSPLOWO2_01_FULL_44_21]|uniref:Zinc metalloprotease n=1 Tax=Candidatus Doudnabacteria bacterium RIFCSPLOWO2_01_FULL_44_21 TaxID=1817841 RepID=A0A1F5PX62_9BACT|nr:MAG: RIP metalloprotease RseP [Candidatus Doudnabacteria bacterium RIFCSPHIGHO2_02_FULL_43_13b]OGE94447.1 MAG: RIP metalloprotease RseP [Candidatus Doudnabacteria bacterium RIFCSPLOWO2_01_FULL_44_21]